MRRRETDDDDEPPAVVILPSRTHTQPISIKGRGAGGGNNIPVDKLGTPTGGWEDAGLSPASSYLLSRQQQQQQHHAKASSPPGLGGRGVPAIPLPSGAHHITTNTNTHTAATAINTTNNTNNTNNMFAKQPIISPSTTPTGPSILATSPRGYPSIPLPTTITTLAPQSLLLTPTTPSNSGSSPSTSPSQSPTNSISSSTTTQPTSPPALSSSPGGFNAAFLPPRLYDEKRGAEINPDDIKLIEKIGDGCFGTVWRVRVH